MRLLKAGGYNQPQQAVVDKALRMASRRLEMLRTVDQAVELYLDMKSSWNTTTKGQVSELLDLSINGPLIDLHPHILTAVNRRTGQAMLVKVLQDDNEAVVVQASTSICRMCCSKRVRWYARYAR